MPQLKGKLNTYGDLEITRSVTFSGPTTFRNNLGLVNPLGDIFYVRNAGSNSNNGRTAERAFKTLPFAVSAADEFDWIICLPSNDADMAAVLLEAVQGTDDANVPINITQNGLKILGPLTSAHMLGSPTYHTHVAAVNVLEINAHMVEISGLTLMGQGVGAGGISIGTTAHTAGWCRTHIHDCSIFGVAADGTAGTYGITTGSMADTPHTVIERNFIYHWGTYGVYFYCGNGSIVQDNHFIVPTAGTGVYIKQTTEGRPDGMILNNKFITHDNSAGFGIVFEGTPDAGHIMIDGNHFVNFADDAHCISSLANNYCGLNYNGHAAMTTT